MLGQFNVDKSHQTGGTNLEQALLRLVANRLKRRLPMPEKHENSNLMLLLALLAVLLILPLVRRTGAVEPEALVCDVSADYALGAEDYMEAIRLHKEVLRENPGNALAHYHLGFAEGMIGNRTAEIQEYQRAEVQGLRI